MKDKDRIYQQEYRKSHREEKREYNKKYYSVNKEVIRKKQNEKYKKNNGAKKEQYKSSDQEPRKKYYIKNRETILGKLKKKYNADKDFYIKKTKRRYNSYKSWKQNIKRKFGLTEDDYNGFLLEQNNCCAICGGSENWNKYGRTTRLSVDHDHKTSKVRGLLCNFCNSGLGSFRDNKNILQAAIRYLERSENATTR